MTKVTPPIAHGRRLLAGLFLASLLLTAVTLAYVAYLFLPIS
ncbi:hypothetical protein [Streptomyces sp. NBC_00989]|nr:hypothetical protein OG714_13185 [Streptomyces sp. NBC_00989]